LKYLLLALGWAAYGAVHSALISQTATRFLGRRPGAVLRFHRLAFNAIAVVLLVPMVWYTVSLSQAPFFRWAGPLRAVQYLLIVCGLLLLAAGGRHYSLGQFVGISQLRGPSRAGLASGGGIDSRGILGVIRHPWYTGVLLLLWATDLDLSRLVTSTTLTAYVLVGTILEERKLVREFGDAYRDYQKRVSMFVPLKWLRSRIVGWGV
jgi:protein-S-isoprenylcysteine O-methyltransferase Ste14